MVQVHKLASPKHDMNIGVKTASTLTQAIGTSGYIQTIMTISKELCGADFVSVFCQGDRDKPLLLGTACQLGQLRAQQAAEGYKKHYSEDRNTDILSGADGEGNFLTIQNAEEISSFTYRRDCYDFPGISSRISLIRRTATYGLTVSLYSSEEHGAFDPENFGTITNLLWLLLVATERHVAFSLKQDAWMKHDVQTRLALTYPNLTRREREVAAMAIKGRTAAESARLLGVSESTIITHRKNAYKRMNVSSLRQLIGRYRNI